MEMGSSCGDLGLAGSQEVLGNSFGEVGLKGLKDENDFGVFNDIRYHEVCESSELWCSEAVFPLVNNDVDGVVRSDGICAFSRECNVASLDFENDLDFSNVEGNGARDASENVVLSRSEQMEQRELGVVIGLRANASDSEMLSDRSCGPSEEMVIGRFEEEGCCALATTQKLTAPCNLTGGSLGIASCCALESGSEGRDFVSGAPTCCSSVVDSSGLGSNGGGDGIKLECVSVSDVTDLISLRRKSNRLTRTRSSTRKFQQTGESISFLGGSVGIFSNNSRRKRSCSCKPARSSVWGALGNLTQVFEQNNGVILECDSQIVHVQNQGLKKVKRGAGKGRQQKTRKGGNSRGYKAKGHRAPATRIRLKVKMEGGRVQISTNVLPEAVDSSSPAQTVVNACVPKSDSQDSLETLKIASEAECKSAADGCGVGQCPFLDGILEKPVTSSDISVRDVHHGDKDLESTVTQDTSVENTLGDCPGVCSRLGTGLLGDAVDDRYSNPGTSPDSGVLHPVPDVCIITSDAAISTRRKATSDVRIMGCFGNLHDASLDCTPSNMQRSGTKKGKKNGKVKQNPCIISGQFSVEEKSFGRTKNSSVRKLTKCRSTQKVRVGSGLTNSKNVSSQASSSEEFNTEPPASEMVELQVCQQNLKAETVTESLALSGQDVGSTQSDPRALECSVSTGKSNGRKPSKKSKSGESKCRSHLPKSARRGRRNARGQKKEDMQNSVYKEEGKHTACLETGGCTSSYLGSGQDLSSSLSTKLSEVNIVGDDTSQDIGKINTGKAFTSEDICSSAVVSTCNNGLALTNPSHSLQMQPLPQQKAWVSCDDCHKWRCISAELADKIEETNCKWTCMDNTDKAFADCLIPQEKSNAEINAELEISDASGEEDTRSAQVNSKKSECRPTAASQRASWALIRNNLFLHRSRKSQTIDEIMVCHCRPPLDGSLGCGDECLNRMLNIECVRGTCPCGDRCSNQQFQKRKYAKFKWIRCGKKGYGLQLQERVSRGAFLIEYVGEVLDMHAYEARQRDYASRGQKHFYFMTLNGSEVIDACAKGNLGRFINHSCDPNCRTEKWMVNGEVCIGLFAIRDIKKGEEVTFDYNYVRVFGAAAKKCVCDSSECRGYIGGDPLNTEVVVQGDSDDDYPEPLMVNENGAKGHSAAEIIQNMSLLDAAVPHAESPLQTSDTMSNSSPAAQKVEISLQIDDTMNKSLAAVQTVDISLPMANTMSKSLPDSVEVTSNSMSGTVEAEPNSVEDNSKSIADIVDKPNSVEDNFKSTPESAEINPNVVEDNQKSIHESVENKSNTVEDNNKSVSDTVINKRSISKSCSLKKSSHSSGSIKKGRVRASQATTNKSKKLVEGTGSGRFEGVEEKLNELLDADGGISKRKDATKGYLKLLLVTAASGDNFNGEAFQSTRDLSMVLDALLKTKSRMVLVDIINKNGLQMLHNIMKQNRRNFNKIPIIRKLLKVLEFLALKEIVTLEHINTAPPCTGMESFRESIIALTRHNDIQVHQIARNFRDKWIPRTIKKVHSDRDDVRLESQSGYYNRFSVSHRRWRDQGVRHTDAIHCVSQEIPMQETIQQEIPVQMSLNADDTPGETSKSPNRQGSAAPSSTGSNPTNGTKKRKRKSRWDQPGETNPDPQPPPAIREQIMEVNLKVEMQSKPPQTEVSEAASNHITEIKSEEKSCNCEADGTGVSRQHVNEEAPPGFPSPLNNPQVPSGSSMDDATPPGFPSPLTNPQAPPSGSSVDAAAPPGFSPPLNNPQPPSGSSMDAATPPGFSPSLNSPQAPSGSSVVATTIANLPPQQVTHTISSCEVVSGNPMRFLAHLPVSYGIPLALVQQLGTPRAEVGDDWVVAPGVPFHPFPPLPPYPRGEPNPPLSSQPSNSNHRMGNVREEAQPAGQYAISHQADATRPSASGAVPPDVTPETRAISPQGDSMRWPSDGLGRRFFRQQKWNNRNFRRCGPPWLRQRNGWGFNNSNNMKGGVCIGNVANEGGDGLCFPENVCSIGSSENASSTYYHQQPQHHYHH